MNRNYYNSKSELFKWLPKYLAKLISKKPELILEENRIKINEIIDNAIISVYTKDKSPIADKKGALNDNGIDIANIIWQYTAGVQLGYGKLWAFLTTDIKIDIEVLCNFACKCALELSKIDNIAIGIHAGKMKLIQQTDASNDFDFEGLDDRIGRLMGEVALIKKKKIIITENVNKYIKDKFKTKEIEVLKLFNGKKLKIYELTGKKWNLLFTKKK